MALFRKKRASSPAGGEGIMFRHADAQRIANAVHAHETSRRGRNPSTLPRAPGGGSGGGIRMARFVGGWPKGESKQVVFSSDTLSTANATNFLRSIPHLNSAAYRTCFVYPSETEAGTYVLINAEP